MLLFPITGARSVTARFTTQLPDFKQRTRAARVFFSPTVSRAQRMGAAGQFHASHALAVKPSEALLAALTRDLGPPLVHTDTFTLYRIPHGDVPVTSSPSALPDDVPSGVTEDAHSDP
jgi:hypothetical protein